MDTCKLSLRALAHPITLFSIALLLINDHLLKKAIPSILTGKLSDFAGLFFFPFLLTIFLAIIGRRWPARRVMALAFAIAAAWFAAIKTWPLANALTANLGVPLFGTSLQIALDPTDLLALVVLWPAWRLWKAIERAPQPPVPGRRAYLALACAALAVVATSPCMPPTRIIRLVVYEGQVYTQTGNPYNPASALVSRDGADWQNMPLADVPEPVIPLLSQMPALPVIACEPDAPNTCYRAAANDQVGISQNGGETWQTTWQIPTGRREFMQRYLSSGFLSCKTYIDSGPYDLALLPTDGGSLVIAAMGNEGVLVRQADGQWQRLAVMDARPTPFAGGNMLTILLGETVAMAILAGLIFYLASWWGTNLAFRATHLSPQRSIKWVNAPMLWGLVCLVVPFFLLFAAVNSRIGSSETLGLILIPTGIIACMAAPLVTWSRAVGLSAQPAFARQARKASLMAASSIFPLAWLAFVAWVFGLLPWYGLAVGVALVIGLLCLVMGVRALVQVQRAIAASEIVEATFVAPVDDAARSNLKTQLRWLGVVMAISIGLTIASQYITGGMNGWIQPAMLQIVMIVSGIAGVWLAQCGSVPGVYAPGAARPVRWVGCLLIGAAWAILLKVALMVFSIQPPSYPTSVGHFLVTVPAQVFQHEVVYRLFGMSLAVFVLSRLRQKGSADRWVAWGSNVAVTLVSLLLSPLFQVLWNMSFDPTRLYYSLLVISGMGVSLLAGRQYLRDGLVGAFCIHFGAKLAASILGMILFV